MSYALAVVVLLLAVLLRMAGLPLLPTGLHDAEITNVVLAENARQGDVRVLYDLDGNGYEGLYPLASALLTVLIGDGPLGYRMISVWLGVLTLAAIYALGVRLFGRVAGLSAMALLSVLLLPTLLSRVILVEAALPLLITTTLLALARALPVYPSLRTERTNTVAFAALGALLGISFYMHPISLLLVLASMGFIVYFVVAQRSLSRRRFSYIGFAILMLLILIMPYLISSINLPELAAGQRIFGNYGGILRSITDVFGAFLLRGDANPLLNVPGRPLLDPLTGLLLLVGFVTTLRYAQQPAYALVLIVGVVLAPAAILADDTPNHLTLTVLLPFIALIFGLGVRTVFQLLNQPSAQRLGIASMVLLLAFNAAWTAESLFIEWQAREDVQLAYNSDLGQLAYHLDVTAGNLNSVVCFRDWVQARQDESLSDPELLLLMMNRSNARLRYIDCRNGLIFTEGGGAEQIIITQATTLDEMHPHLRGWINAGTFINNTRLPENRVVHLDVRDQLADALGLYITTAPANYAIEALTDGAPVPPPVRFGGNVTWLGYQRLGDGLYAPGVTYEIANYWRVEGVIPPDLQFFTHILRDPVSIAAQRDVISTNPRHLRERDVLVQITQVPLPSTIIAGEYIVSVGAYQENSGERLMVFDTQQIARGDRLFLYAINITEADADTTDETSDTETAS